MASGWSLMAMSAAWLVSAAGAMAQAVSPDGAWQRLEVMPAAVEAAEAWIRPFQGQSLALNLATVTDQLAGAPLEGEAGAWNGAVVVTLPDADGGWQSFRVVRTAILEPELAALFPTIKTYYGQGVDDPTATMALDVTPRGLRAQVINGRGRWFIDPYSRDDTEHYSVYWGQHLKARHRWACHVSDEPVLGKDEGGGEPGPTQNNSGSQLRTYRLAVAATGSYTQFHGGTVELAMAAITTTVNRVAGIYRREVAVSFTLVNNNNLLVFTDPNTDPYNESDLVSMLATNQTEVDNRIGSANYNIGHVFGIGGGGVAQLNSVCRGSSKARGVTTLGTPLGDVFDVDYVAHEIGHQFNGAHTFNGLQGSCGGAWTSTSAFEPGSGSTIMAYAGICGSDNVQPNSDAFFHSRSYDQIRAFVEFGFGANCGTPTTTGNSAPTVNAGPDLVIPRQTPFTLTATASDPQNDSLTYSWEQRDLGPQQPLAAKDNGSGPLFRAFAPTSSPSRTFPRMSVILNNANVDPSGVEELPAFGRTMNMRVMARDNRDGGGGVRGDDLVVSVASNAGPFRVTNPNGGDSVSDQTPVTWNVAGTNTGPINTELVNITLSTDGGLTFPFTLASGVPNDGLQVVTFPSLSTPQARVRIEAVGNVYFDVSDSDFTVTPPIDGVALQATNINGVQDTANNGNGNGLLDPGELGVGLQVQLLNRGLTTATDVVATLESLTPTVTVVGATASYPDMARNQTGLNGTPFLLSMAPDHPCGAPVSLRLMIQTGQTPQETFTTLLTGTVGASAPPVEFTYTGNPVPIPDFPGEGVEASVSVQGVQNLIGDVTFRFDQGQMSCSADPEVDAGLQHTWVGDLVVTLVSPGGVEVVLANRPGGLPPGSAGNNFCGTVFSDAALQTIQDIETGGAPYNSGGVGGGPYAPAESLLAFRNQSANGLWKVRVQDFAGADVGVLRKFTVIITPRGETTCQPVGTPTCFVDFNADGFLNQEDLIGFLTAFLTEPNPLPGPSGTSRAPCPGEPSPYNTEGYAADFNRDCSFNQEDLGGFITEFFTEAENPVNCVPG